MSGKAASGGPAGPASPGRSVFDCVARSYDVAFALTEFLIGRIFRRHLAYLGLAPVGRILDVGCGTGWLAIRLNREGYAVVGVDSSPT